MNILGVEQTQDVVEVALEIQLASENVMDDVQSKIMRPSACWFPVLGSAVLFSFGCRNAEASLPRARCSSDTDWSPLHIARL